MVKTFADVPDATCNDCGDIITTCDNCSTVFEDQDKLYCEPDGHYCIACGPESAFKEEVSKCKTPKR